MNRIVKELKTEGITALEKLSEKQFENIIKKANDAYYNDKSLMTDNEFDIIKEYFERTFPDNMFD